jgi:hypothetical protein
VVVEELVPLLFFVVLLPVPVVIIEPMSWMMLGKMRNKTRKITKMEITSVASVIAELAALSFLLVFNLELHL